jgi:hypothetical protein
MKLVTCDDEEPFLFKDINLAFFVLIGFDFADI